jgi:diguanylate cyclase (GGDEF)-like protein
MVDVINATLQKKPETVSALSELQDSARLRLAVQAGGVVAFDWSIFDDKIVWDGAIDILPFHLDADRMRRGQVFLDWLSPEGRSAVLAVADRNSFQPEFFDIDVEASSAMGSLWFTMVGTRMPAADGRTERLAGLLRVTTEKKREAQRLTYLATRDELTGHLNRNSLREELAQAIERAKDENRHCAFLVASIDRLAMVNDGFGFDNGDEVIVAVGERLSRCLRASDIIGRTAGNKFGVILKNCSEREVAIVADRLRAAVRGSVIDTRGDKVSATSSVGAVWLPSGASSSQEAMLRAEETLERARGKGRDGFAVYQKSPQRETARLRLMSIADEVVEALRDNRLALAYQPIIGAKSRATSHYESLLRMRKEDGSIVTAGAFIPAAEQLGIVQLVDRFALESIVAKLKAHPSVTLAVNVSGTTAGDPAWLQSFVDYVRVNRAVADRLIVELTETAALHHFEENAQFVSQLREMGVRVAIDDFGAGYTSFRNLQMLHVDTVKIDGSYVKDLSASPENQVFVRTLVGLAKNFNMKTVAEWVGSDKDAALLEGFGVDYFQGFFFGEPQLDPDWK